MTPTRRALVIVACVAAPALARSQVRASELASVSQVIDGAHLAIEYSRPSARGRTLFGQVVPWGETWTPGANWATTFAVDRDVDADGHRLPKGKYSVWMVPGKGDWEVLFARPAHRFHMSRPKKDDVALRYAVRPEEGPHTELLTWSVPSVRGDSATLRMQWGTTSVPLHLVVAPAPTLQLTAAQAAAYTGQYRVRFEGDSASYRFDVTRLPNGRLRAAFDSAAGVPGLDAYVDLIPTGPGRFAEGDYASGTFIGVEQNVVWTPRAGVLEMRALADTRVIGRGRRVK